MRKKNIKILDQNKIGIIVLSLFGFSPNYFNIISLVFGVILTVLLLSFLQNALSMIVSAIFRTPEAAPGGMWLVLIPLMTFSGGFFPLEIVAPSLIPYVGWIPTRIVVILFQDIMINAVSLWNVRLLMEFAILIGEGLLLHLLGIKLYKRFVQS